MPGKRIDHACPHIVDAHIIAVHPLDKSAGSEGKRLFEQLIAAHPEIVVFQHLAHPLLQLLSPDADLDLLIERQIRPVLRDCLRHAEAAPLARQLAFAVILAVCVKRGNFAPIPRLPDLDALIRRIRRAAEAPRLQILQNCFHVHLRRARYMMLSCTCSVEYSSASSESILLVPSSSRMSSIGCFGS